MKTRLLIPKKGTVETVIERLVEYLTQNSFAIENTKGASEELIQKYIEITKVNKLPIIFKHFLEVFGIKHGGFLDKSYDYDIKEIIEFYIEVIEPEQDVSLDLFPLFCTSYMDGDEICLDLKTNFNNPPVFMLYSYQGEILEMFSSSLEFYLMYFSIRHIEERKRKFGFWASNSPDSARKSLPFRNNIQSSEYEINRIANKLGLKKVWMSDSYFQVFMGKNMSILYEIGEKNRVMIYLFTDIEINKIILKEIENIFGTREVKAFDKLYF